MKNIAWLFIVALMACSSGSSSTTTNPPPPPPPPPPPAGNPPKPAIGATQVDRMGRPVVNTALINPFASSSQVSGQSKDAYNANANASTWAASFSAQIQASLAIFDGLDGVCGNQVLAGATLNATRYSTLATVLADDRLYVRTDKTTCAAYLGVETDAVGLTTSGDCGGRTPIEDTIKETYSLLLIGSLTGVTDGLPTNGTTGLGSEQDGFPSTTTFPFLTLPH